MEHDAVTLPVVGSELWQWQTDMMFYLQQQETKAQLSILITREKWYSAAAQTTPTKCNVIMTDIIY